MSKGNRTTSLRLTPEVEEMLEFIKNHWHTLTFVENTQTQIIHSLIKKEYQHIKEELEENKG